MFTTEWMYINWRLDQSEASRAIKTPQNKITFNPKEGRWLGALKLNPHGITVSSKPPPPKPQVIKATLWISSFMYLLLLMGQTAVPYTRWRFNVIWALLLTSPHLGLAYSISESTLMTLTQNPAILNTASTVTSDRLTSNSSMISAWISSDYDT